MKFSLKAKILTAIISLSVIGLSVFAYLTFQTYQEDKQAFIYDHLTSETQSKSKLFAVVTEDYDLLLSTIISRIDSSSKSLPSGMTSFLEGDQSKVLGIYYHIPLDLVHSYSTLFEAPEKLGNWNWATLDAAGAGLSLLDEKQGLFLFKKSIGENSFAAIVFRQVDMWKMLGSNHGKKNFAFSRDKILAKDPIALGKEDFTQMKGKIEENPGHSGLFVSDVDGEPHYVTFSKLGIGGLTLVSLIPESKVHLVQKVFLRQVVAFLILMASISLFIGTLAARWLTLQLDQLTVAAREIEKENFDFELSINSRDELASLGTAFNSMGQRIKGLLDELRIYNVELEMKVEARTKELKELTEIQKGMLDSLGQGFVIINRENKILPIYSKVAKDMFEVDPVFASPTDIMGVPETDAQSFRELFEMIFGGVLAFDDMARLAPELRSNSKNQQIQLTYTPVYDENDQFNYVMVVGTDKTAEFENMEKFKKEWNFSQMIYKIASNRFAFNKLLSESLHMLDTCFNLLDIETPYAVKDVQRLVHTVKGNFSYFNITEVTQKCHALETYLEQYFKEATCPEDVRLKVLDDLKDIHTAIHSFIEEFESVVQFKQTSTTKNVPLKDLKDLAYELKVKSPELGKLFQEKIFKAPVETFFQLYPSLVKELGIKLNKSVKFTLIGGETEIPDGPWENLFPQFVHFVRNSVDHGIEYSEERISQGKDPQGEITFEFKREERNGEKYLMIELRDDGRGVNWKKLAEKDPSVTSLEDALERIKSGGISSKDSVSDVSGRGVGVSAIFSAVESLSGTAQFESIEGKSLKISIELPLREAKQVLKLAA
jgi:two-component system chemotaxis sensor kinase CheA